MGEHFCGSVITHYDTFILRLQSAAGSPRGMRLLREPWPQSTIHCIIDYGMGIIVLAHPVLHRCRPQPGSGLLPGRPSSGLRTVRWGRGMRGECDGCDGIFDTDPTAILIVTTVTNRHTSCFRSRIALPFLVRFTVYSTPYSLSSSPAFTLSCRVRILGCISS